MLLQGCHLSGGPRPSRLPRPRLALRAVVVPVLRVRQRAGMVAAILRCIHAAAAVGPGAARRRRVLVPQCSCELHLSHAGKLFQLLGCGVRGAKLAGHLLGAPGGHQVRCSILRRTGWRVAGMAWQQTRVPGGCTPCTACPMQAHVQLPCTLQARPATAHRTTRKQADTPRREATTPPTEAPTAPVMLQAKLHGQGTGAARRASVGKRRAAMAAAQHSGGAGG